MSKDYSALAQSVLKNIGGAENVSSFTHCVTRLRFVLKDEEKANTDEIKKTVGVIDVVKGNGQYQVVIGPGVSDAYDAVLKAANGALDASSKVEEKPAGKKNPIELLADTITAIFTPILGAFAAVGLLKAFIYLFTQIGVLSTDSNEYMILWAACDAFFVFLPFALAYSSADRFKCNKFTAVAVVAALFYPTITAAQSAGDAVSFFGIPVTLMSYNTSVIPAILTVYVLSWVERGIYKIVPEMLKFFLAPALCILIMVPVELIAIGPLSQLAGQLISDGFMAIYSVAPIPAAMIFGLLYPILIIFGAHWFITPIKMNNYATLGYDWLSPLNFGCNFAMAGCALGVFLKTKNKGLKELSGPTAFTALVAGITEPCIYGVNLKFKRPFAIACVLTAIGSIFTAVAGTKRMADVGVNLLGLPAMAAFPGGWAIVAAAVVGFFGGAILTYLFGFNDNMIPESER